MKGKVAVIGAGNVGASAAYAMLIKGVTPDIALIDVNKEKAWGEAMDLNHGSIFIHRANVMHGGDYKLCKGSDVIVICAGSARKPGESRLDLAKKNASIFREMVPQIMKHCRDAVMVVVTNPVDVMTYFTLKLSGLPESRVFGTGTLLDTARLRYMLGEHFHVSPASVHASILGEHGDSQFPLWSSASIGNVPIAKMPGFSRAGMKGMFESMKKAAADVIKAKGATYYAIGLSVSRVVEAILSDSNEVLPLSCMVNGYHGISDVCLSVPVVVGREGIAKQPAIPMTKEEKALLANSAKILKGTIKEVMG